MKELKKQKLTQKRLKELLHYDPDTGVFTWKVRRGRIKAGSIAGCIHPNGYRRIHIDKILYSEHRLAWLYVYGEFPKKSFSIDHINHIRDCNPIKNLRSISQSGNMKNCDGLRSNNTSGVTGVFRDGDAWRAFTKKSNSTVVYHGVFTSFSDAVRARLAGEIEHEYNKYKKDSEACKWLIDNNEPIKNKPNIGSTGFRRNANKSGVMGVSWVSEREKWDSRVTVNKKIHCLGTYTIFGDAVLARWEAEKKYNYPNCQTSSSAYLYLKKLGFV